MMAVFETASEAVTAALRIQEKVRATNEYQLRIGIHLGEVIVDQEDIFGDGVNIARGSGSKAWILQDPDYDSLRDDPRYIALMEKKE
jgi:adenylate cyclase